MRTARELPTPWACRKTMISRTIFCAPQALTIHAALTGPIPSTSPRAQAGDVDVGMDERFKTPGTSTHRRRGDGESHGESFLPGLDGLGKSRILLEPTIDFGISARGRLADRLASGQGPLRRLVVGRGGLGGHDPDVPAEPQPLRDLGHGGVVRAPGDDEAPLALGRGLLLGRGDALGDGLLLYRARQGVQ